MNASADGPRRTIEGILTRWAREAPMATALSAPGVRAVSYSALCERVQRRGASLRSLGIRREDRVAIVLPNGLPMAETFLSTASVAIAAPLNPDLKEPELEFYLTDMSARAVLVEPGSRSPVRDVARKLGIRLVELDPELAPNAGHEESDPAKPDDVALILHTSGTTSRPKIIPLTHRNLTRNAENIQRALELAPGDLCLNVMPLFHIHGLVAAILASLTAGASVSCTPGFDASRFLTWFQEAMPSWYTAVPTMHQAILSRVESSPDWTRGRLRFVRSSSAAMPVALLERLESALGVPVIEAYGMTEASHQVASNPLPPRARKPGSVGLPTGPEVAILDEKGEPQPPGKTGEVAIQGANVYREGWFRTGDLGYRDEDGYVFLSGRIKEIINRGGEKVTPREVDEVLLEHPAVEQAVTFALPDPKLGEEVGAAIVLKAGFSPTQLELRELVARKLADFKVPRRVFFLEAIPKGPTGKLQRIGLAAKLGVSADDRPARAFEAPSGALEETLSGIWRELLGLERVSAVESFFELGGDSILAVQVLARVVDLKGVEVSPVVFMEDPTIRGLARAIGSSTKSACPITKAKGEAPLLSLGQEHLWILMQFYPVHALHNRLETIRLPGSIEPARIARALEAIVARHEPLRTHVHARTGAAVATISPPAPVELPVSEVQEHALEPAIQEEANRPIDVSAALPFRARLFQVPKGDGVLALVFHQLMYDEPSAAIVRRELGRLLAGETLPPLAIAYRDYVAWQHAALEGPRLEAARAFWQEKLAKPGPVIEPLYDRPRPRVSSFEVSKVPVSLSVPLADELRAIGTRHGLTLFVLLLSAWKALLARRTGVLDSAVQVFGTTRTRTELEPLVGTMVALTLVRTDLGDDPSFVELARRVSGSTAEAVEQRDSYGLVLQSWLARPDLEWRPDRQPIFELTRSEASDNGLDIHPRFSPKELSLELRETPGGISGELIYANDVFDRQTATSLVESYGALLEGIAIRPDSRLTELPLLRESDRRRVLHEWNATERPHEDPAPAHVLFERQAGLRPDRTAIACGEKTLTYRELDDQATRLAKKLRALGVGRDALVGVCVEQSPALVVALLATLKAGGAYLPLDTKAPKQRIALMLDDACPKVVVASAHGAKLLGQERGAGILRIDAPGDDREAPLEPVSQAQLAYGMFTSGSTGRPKCSLIEHGSLTNLLLSVGAFLALDERDRILQNVAIGFDVSLEELLLPLVFGARLVVPKADRPDGPHDMVRTIVEQAVTVVHSVPAMLHLLLDHEDATRCTSLRHVISGGEALPAPLARRFMSILPGVALHNFYGPTEAAIWATIFTCDPSSEAATVPIGRPVSNTQAYVLDAWMKPVPIGAQGEIYLGGAGIARGYLDRAELEKQRFVPDPFTGTGRLYRTGDLGRFRPDGVLEYLGRMDRQLKIRGTRIEPAEIEQALLALPGMRQALVVCRGGVADPTLVAYLVADEPLAPDDLRERLSKTLLSPMVPREFFYVKKIPLSSNGKVDLEALATEATEEGHNRTRSRGNGATDAPTEARSELETKLAELWGRVLKVKKVGVLDGFFDLGGHSLLATDLFLAIEQEIGVSLPLNTIFDAPNVRAMARVIEGAETPRKDPCLLAIQTRGSRPPLFCVHARDGYAMYFRDLADHLGPDQPVYGLQAVGVDGRETPLRRVEDMAARYIQAMRSVQREGPYYVGGQSFGGIVAYEIAQQLVAQGEKIGLLALFDTGAPEDPESSWTARLTERLAVDVRRVGLHVRNMTRMGPGEQVRYGLARVRGIANRVGSRVWRVRHSSEDVPVPSGAWNVAEANVFASMRYTAKPFGGKAILFRASELRDLWVGGEDRAFGWGRYMGSNLEIVEVLGNHSSILGKPEVAGLAGVLTAAMARGT